MKEAISFIAAWMLFAVLFVHATLAPTMNTLLTAKTGF